jgi:lipopolysaccharide export system permease protein
MIILWRHILRTHILPFFFSVLLMMCIFLLQFLMKFLDQLAGKGLSTAIIAELVVLNLAWMLVLAVPMGVLVATLMAFGKLASTNEITAIRASGVSLYKMMAPAAVASVFLCYAMILFNNDVLPNANHRTRTLMNDISRKKPTLSLVPGMFTQLMQGHTILVHKTFEHSNDLEGVSIFDYSRPAFSTTITAQRGTISFSPDYLKLIMDLWDGEIHQLNTGMKGQYRIIRFQKHRIVMEAEGFNFQRTDQNFTPRGDRELSANDMRIKVDSLRNLQHKEEDAAKQTLSLLKTGSSPSSGAPVSSTMLKQTIENKKFVAHLYELEAGKYLVEIHKKYSIPCACFVFVLIGAPLGIMARRGTFGIGASLSLGFFTLYWACLRGGETLADHGLIAPWLSMWMADIILGVVGIYLTYKVANENVIIDWSWFSKLIPKSWRADAQTPKDNL